MKQEFIIPFRPDSVNSHWQRGRGNIVFVSKKGKEFRDNVKRFMLSKKIKKHTGDIEVSIKLFFKSKRDLDVDNYFKSILDALNGILWVDDKQIQKISAVKNIGTGEKDYFVITVAEYERA